MDATPVATRLRRSTPEHDAYTVRVADRRLVALATGHPADARRWIYTTRWLHQALLLSGRLVVGLGVQWTPFRARGVGPHTPPPATLQLCVGHRCLVFHLAQVDAEAVPAVLYRFLADPRVVFVGYGSSYDCRMLWDHYGLDVASARDLRALTGMGNASVELMAERFLGYRGISKARDVAMSAWHAPRLSVEQVEYACVDAHLAFRLGLLLCPGGYQPVQRAPAPPRATPPAPVFVEAHRAPSPVMVLPRAPPPAPRAPERPRAPPPAPRAPGRPRAPPPAPRALMIPRAPPPAPRALVTRCALSPPRRAAVNPHTPEPHQALALMAVAVETAESSSKVAALPGFTGSETDTDSEAERGGLYLVRWNYASDDDDDDLSSDGYEFVGRGAVTDDDEEEEDVYGYVARTGLLSDGDYVVGPGIQSDDEEEHSYEGYVLGTGALNAEDDGEQGYAYKEHAGIGILTVEDHVEEGYKVYTGILTVGYEAAAYEDEVFVGNGHATVVEVEESGLQLDVYQEPPECYDNSIEEFQGGDDGHSQDDGGDWYEQGGDGYVQADDSYDAFY
ncbi:hypothetical protein D1007_45815 [Hordeum vulgare]|uniref:3'-5' exonuclease domain-containing protein n=1 Tax=Hordeum vulgare subsp. vulgare TaxID=112509 RepID=A0A8I7B2W7_HORVV|nr:hypothetical protein D1007_45815 [Hordeum vulgare]KAI5012702.1 hypothetical protein ZWY2020_024968 [Hordeum vulgare]